MFHQKLKSLKFVLRELNRNRYGDIHGRTKEAFALLCDAQAQVLANPCANTFLLEAEASRPWHHLATVEEKFLLQKSRIQWLTVGDQNTTFYHHVVQERTSRNNISVLYNERGEVLLDPEDIKQEAVRYFHNFLQTDPVRSTQVQIETLNDLLRYRCPQADSAQLIAPLTPSKIFTALKNLPN